MGEVRRLFFVFYLSLGIIGARSGGLKRKAVQESSSTTTTTTESDNDWYSYFITTPAPYINHQSLVSPLTKNTHSSKPTSVPELKPSNDVVSLAIYSALAICGSTVNIFEISSLIVEQKLHHHGNVYLANQAFANLLVTTLGMPAFAIAILSNNHISPFVCYWQWYIALQSFGTSCFNYFFIALENLLRAYRSRRKDSRNKNIGAYSYFCGVKVVIVLVVFPGQLLAYGPILLTTIMFLLTIQRYKKHLKVLESRRCLESREEHLQRQLVKSNAVAYLIFLGFWMPFLITIVTSSPETIIRAIERDSSQIDYVSGPTNSVENALRIAQSFSCFCPFIYAFTNGTFAQAFVHLVKYFCCKSHSEFSKSTLQERPRGTIRVHIGMETRSRGNAVTSVVTHEGSRNSSYL